MTNRELAEEIKRLRDEIERLRGEVGREAEPNPYPPQYWPHPTIIPYNPNLPSDRWQVWCLK